MAVFLWTEVAEGSSPDFAFAAARAQAQQRGDVEQGIFRRTTYQILDNTIFPSDRFAAARAEDRVGTWPQPGQDPVIGPYSPHCFALKIKPQRPGHTRIMFFGLRNTQGPTVQLPLPTAPSNPADFRPWDQDRPK